MKIVTATALVCFAATAAFAQQPMEEKHPAPSTNTSFEKLKSLAGTWDGTGPEGKLVNRVRVISNGSALEEAFSYGGKMEMVSVYSADGPRLAMTHYCSIGNQPRMATAPLNGPEKRYEFVFTGATNLAHAEDPHMARLVLSPIDDNHFDEEWTYVDHGKARTSVFHFTRTASPRVVAGLSSR